MILAIKLKLGSEDKEVKAWLPELRSKLEDQNALILNLIFSQKQLSTYFLKESVVLLYNLEPSFPPFYVLGWLLMAFFILLGFPWWALLLPALLGFSGLFQSKEYFKLMFLLAARKKGLKQLPKFLKLSTFIKEVIFKHGAN